VTVEIVGLLNEKHDTTEPSSVLCRGFLLQCISKEHVSTK
jgi:hypothetical protein